MIKRIAMWAILIVIAVFGLTACQKCQRPAVVVQIQTNETAILVDMRATDAVALEGSIETRRDIRIGGYWVQTARFDWQGHWRPTHKVMVVSRRPVNITWNDESSKNANVARAVSSGQAGFRIPLVINAVIENDTDAQKYLRYFRSNELVIDRTEDGTKYWLVREEARPLEEALNDVIFPIIQNSLRDSFITIPTIDAESRSTEFIKKAEGDARIVAEQYGITILNLTGTDGILFDNNDFQIALENRAVLQLREDVLAQERRNAEVQQQVSVVEANTRQRVAAIEAQTASSRLALQRIENERIIAEATARAIETGKVVPAGSYPTGLNSLIITPNYNSFR